MNWIINLFTGFFKKKPDIGIIRISTLSSPEGDDISRRAYVEYPFNSFGLMEQFGMLFGICIDRKTSGEHEVRGFNSVIMSVSKRFKIKKEDLDQLLSCDSVVFYPVPDYPENLNSPGAVDTVMFFEDVKIYAAVLRDKFVPGCFTCATDHYCLSDVMAEEGISEDDRRYATALISRIGHTRSGKMKRSDYSDSMIHALRMTRFFNITIQYLKNDAESDVLVCNYNTGEDSYFKEFSSGWRRVKKQKYPQQHPSK